MTKLWVLSADARTIVRASDITEIFVKEWTPTAISGPKEYELVVRTASSSSTLMLARTDHRDIAEAFPTTLAATIVGHSEGSGVIACMNIERTDIPKELFEHFTWVRAIEEAGHGNTMIAVEKD